MNAFKHFGVMLDCSRGAVPTVKTVKKWIDALQKMGYDTLELYTEDTFEVTDEPYFGFLRGRYTGKEIQEIDAYAAKRGIELIPCVQTMGYFTNPVKLPKFSEITDVNDILLIDEGKTYQFIERIFKSLAKNFTSYENAKKRAEEFYEVFETRWHTENKPFGFKVHCVRLGGLAKRLAYCKKRLQAYVNGELQMIEELDEDILPYYLEPDDNEFWMGRYCNIVTACEL